MPLLGETLFQTFKFKINISDNGTGTMRFDQQVYAGSLYMIWVRSILVSKFFIPNFGIQEHIRITDQYTIIDCLLGDITNYPVRERLLFKGAR